MLQYHDSKSRVKRNVVIQTWLNKKLLNIAKKYLVVQTQLTSSFKHDPRKRCLNTAKKY